MKSPSKVLVSLFALGLLAAAPFAQAADDKAPPAQGQGQRGGRGGRGGMTIEVLEGAVGTLTADQKTKIEAILAKQREAMQALGQDDMEKRRELQTKTRADIRALLTPEQQTKFDAMPQGGRGQGGRQGGGKKNN